MTQPFLALPCLQAYLRQQGYDDIRIWDVSQRAMCELLSEHYLRGLADDLDRIIAHLSSRTELDVFEAMRYERAITGRAALDDAAGNIASAIRDLRDPETFFEPGRYFPAMDVLERAFQVLAGRHFPEDITLRNYVASVIDDLDRDDELQRYLEDPEHCLFRRPFQEIVPEIAASRPDIIGLSATFQDQFLPALVLAGMLRTSCPEAVIVLGGAFPSARISSLQRRAWLFDIVDGIVVNEGEAAILGIAQAVEGRCAWDEVPNLLRRVDGKVVRPEHRRYEPLNELPAPDYTGFDIGDYLVPRWDVLYDPTRGCYWNRCTFCTVSMSTKGSDRTRAPMTIVDHLEMLCERHQTDTVTFAVDALPVPLMNAVCEEILRRELDVGWSSECILDGQLTRPTLELWSSAGCLLLLFGLESASPRVVRAMKKGTRVDRSERIIRDCGEVGIAVLLHLMVGYPGETEEDLEETLSFVERLRDAVDIYEINPFHLDEGAPIAGMLDGAGVRRAGRTRREFNVATVRSYQVSSGISADRSVDLSDAAAERLDKALSLLELGHLRDDGAHLHLYLKTTRTRPRDIQRAPVNTGVRLGTEIVPMRPRFDLATIGKSLTTLRKEHRMAVAVTDMDGGELWRQQSEGWFALPSSAAGVLDLKGPRFTALDEPMLTAIAMFRNQPELLGELDRLETRSRRVLTALLQAINA